MDNYDYVLDKVKEIIARSKHSATNVTEYMGPSLRLFSEVTGQRTKYSGFNWDTRVRSRSAKYTVIIGSDEVTQKCLSSEQQETRDALDVNLTRVFGGCIDGKEYKDGIDLTQDDLVNMMNSNTEIATAAATLGDIEKAYKDALEEADHVVYLPLTKGLSSSYNNAVMVANEDEFKGKVSVVDSEYITP